MLYRTLSLNQLMQLDPPALLYALRLFEQELNGSINLLQSTPDARNDEQALDDLNQLLTLRKVFKGRLAELEQEASAARAAAPQPFTQAA